MSYQNVSTPRFYIDQLSWLKSLGVSSGSGTSYFSNAEGADIATLYELHPSTQFLEPSTNGTHWFYYNPNVPMYKINFFAILGHSGLMGRNIGLRFDDHDPDAPGSFVSNYPFGDLGSSPTTSINVEIGGNAGNQLIPSYNGFSLIAWEDSIDIAFAAEDHMYFYIDYISGDIKIGSLCLGSYYDMPNAPNLSLTLSHEYGSTKEFTTYNGSSVSNTMWTKQPMWGDLGAWELDDGTSTNQALARSGRRTWQLKFSYMDDGDLFGPNQYLATLRPENPSWVDLEAGISGYDSGDLQGNADPNPNQYVYNLITDDSFFSQVWHKTLGGTLPFIFQPDGGANGNNNPDQFSICRFKSNSLKATQTAFHVYDISLQIEEVW